MRAEEPEKEESESVEVVKTTRGRGRGRGRGGAAARGTKRKADVIEIEDNEMNSEKMVIEETSAQKSPEPPKKKARTVTTPISQFSEEYLLLFHLIVLFYLPQ